MIASGDTEGRIGIWDARDGAFMHQIKTGSYVGKLKSVVFSEDAANLITVLSTGTVLIHDIQSGSCEQAFDLSSPSGDWSIELSHDFAIILTASSDDNTAVRIWDPQTQTKSLKRARSREKSILEVEISPNGRTVVLLTVDGHEIWSLRRSKFECLLVGDSDFIEFSPDYSLVVVASETSITMCNVQPGYYTRSFDIETMVKCCLYSDDCKTLVTFHMDYTWHCWHLGRHNYTRIANASYIQTNRGFFHEPRRGNVILDDIVIQVVVPPHRFRMVREWSACPALTRDQSWIMIGNEKFFRLSPECLNAEVKVSGRTVNIDCTSGRLIILSFDVSKAGRLFC
jgi:WD40 repeat protein